MSYFVPYLDANGIHIPTYKDRMEELTTGYKQIFGEDVYIGEDTQDYQLMSLFAKAMDDVTQLALDVYNARNPNWATKTALDNLLPLSGIHRNAATYSTAILTLTGLPGATLAEDMLARDTAGHSWRTLESVEFDSNGNATVEAVCTEAGAIAASAGTITTIETPAYTWYTVTNPADATMGRDTETDAAVRVRRAQSVALPGLTTIDAIHAALVNLDGVDHVAVLENCTDLTDANGLPPHSICALVLGGEPTAIAEAIYRKKAPGIATYGNTDAVYVDAYSHTNTVRFSRPTNVMTTVSISIRPLQGWDSEHMPASIANYVVAYINSSGIGDDLVVSALWGEVFKASANSPAFSILGINAKTADTETTTDTIRALYDTKFVCDAAHVNVFVEEA